MPCASATLARDDRIVQTLTNLIGNAVKFSTPWVFRRFVQVQVTDGRGRAGAGLGPAISRNIAQRRGGRIWVMDASGTGATLYFTGPSCPRARFE